MAKKTIFDEVYGKITFKEGYWSLQQKTEMIIIGKQQEVKTEILSFSTVYDKIQLGLFTKEVEGILLKSSAFNEEEVLKNKDIQRNLYKNLLIDNINMVEKNIETAAVQELAKVLEDYDEQNLPKHIAKAKALKLLSAKTVEEKLESLQLSLICVFLDRIEIKCKCDWYDSGGGFIIIDNGECMMRPIDCLSN